VPATIPASVRNNNPGAMYPGPSATKFGAKKVNKIGGGHLIAEFPDAVHGAAAQFDLLSRVYTGMRVDKAIAKWSGGNSVDSYLDVIGERTGLQPDDTLTAAYLRKPKTGIKFAQAMAAHEAGEEFPMTKAEWKEAHALAFDGADIVPDKQGGGFFQIPAADKPSLGATIAALARGFEGVREKPGKGNAQQIDDWYDVLQLPRREDDEVPWCKLFSSAMWKMGGAVVEDPSDENILLARNHLKLGTAVDKDHPELIPLGSALVWKRGAYPSGHVGIAVEIDVENEAVICMEGNLSNKVTRVARAFADVRGDSCLGVRAPVADLRRPNGTKSIPTTVKTSPTLRLLAGAWAAVAAAVTSSVDAVNGAISGVFDFLPGTADKVQTVVGSTRTIADSAGIPLTTYFYGGLAAICIVSVTVRLLGKRQVNPA
jgi:hypothetical protein